MATSGERIVNNKTGESITWLETAADTHGQRLAFEMGVVPGGSLPVSHCHPNQSETFEISQGVLHFSLGKRVFRLGPGERLVVPPSAAHRWWNESETTPVVGKVIFEPALNTEVFLEQFYGLSNDNKTAADGTPAFLQLMAMLNEYHLQVAGPPLFLQKLMGYVLGGLARLLGYRKFYPAYSPAHVAQLKVG
jgi:quercetin dioxygenase-like cupin family protein